MAWIKSDSKAILAIHNRLVAHNSRLSVTHNGHNTWKLHILNIQKNDSGSYMCQINTDPMRWQVWLCRQIRYQTKLRLRNVPHKLCVMNFYIEQFDLRREKCNKYKILIFILVEFFCNKALVLILLRHFMYRRTLNRNVLTISLWIRKIQNARIRFVRN